MRAATRPAEQARHSSSLELWSSAWPAFATCTRTANRTKPAAASNVSRSTRTDGGDIRALVKYLAAGSPSIRTRNHHLDDGVALIDPREIDAAQAAVIAERVRAFFEST